MGQLWPNGCGIRPGIVGLQKLYEQQNNFKHIRLINQKIFKTLYPAMVCARMCVVWGRGGGGGLQTDM